MKTNTDYLSLLCMVKRFWYQAEQLNTLVKQLIGVRIFRQTVLKRTNSNDLSIPRQEV